ncbi:MAG: hypothetical protein ACLFPD_04130 [Desulfosudaceae bacterium]
MINQMFRCICSSAFPAAMLIFMLAAAGCGKKVWPEPDTSAEQFALSINQHQYQGNCLLILGRISGKAENLAGITLELEETSTPCPACPFKLSASAEYFPGSPGFSTDKDRFTLRYCALNRDKYYRARLKGKNTYSAIKDTYSRVVSLDRE